MVRRAGANWRDYPDTSTLVTAQDYKDYSDGLDCAVGAGRTRGPICEATLGSSFANLTTGDYWAADGWAATVDPDSMFTAGTGQTAPAKMTIPLAGRYELLHQFCASGSTLYACKILLNPATTPFPPPVTVYSIASGQNAEGTPCAITTWALAAGDRIYWAAWATSTFTWQPTDFGTIRSRMVVRWVGPA